MRQYSTIVGMDLGDKYNWYCIRPSKVPAGLEAIVLCTPISTPPRRSPMPSECRALHQTDTNAGYFSD